MTSGLGDIQFIELKDTITQLNHTIKAQTALIESLKKTMEDRDAKEKEKDQLISNLQAQLDYLKAKLFGTSSEKHRIEFPGQMNLFL